MRRAEDLDRTLLLSQLVRGVEDIDEHPHRDRLDTELGAPVGREADELAGLVAYLKG